MNISIDTERLSRQELHALQAFFTVLETGVVNLGVPKTDTAVSLGALEVTIDQTKLREAIEVVESDLDAQDPARAFGAPLTEEPDGPAPTGDLDSAGEPWDERIHASTKATVKDGTWKMKRGVSDDLVAQIKAERAGVPISQPVTAAAPVPQVPAAPVVPNVVAPVTPPPPAAVTGDAPAMTFIQFMSAVNAAGKAGEVAKVVLDLGLPNVIALNNPANAANIPLVLATLGIEA